MLISEHSESGQDAFTIVGVHRAFRLGNLKDEVARRRREIAIRKVSGASVADILRLIRRDISLLALPALVLGGLVSWLISREWLTRYPDRITQPLWLFAALLVGAYLLILACLALRALKAARENPAEAQKG